MKKLLFRSAAVLLICFSGFGLTAYAQSVPFSDHIGHEFEEAIEYLYSEGIIDGYPNGTFLPDGGINRAELLKIIIASNFKTFEYEGSASDCFPDIIADQWYSQYVCFAKNKGIIEGYPDGTFKPDQNINLVEALKVIYEGMDVAIDNTDAVFKFKYYSPAMRAGYLPESLSGEFEKELTRAEVSEIIYRMLMDSDKELKLDVNLGLTVYRQKYDASCSMAALATALSQKVVLSEDDVINKMISMNMYPNNALVNEDGVNKWDDPREVFVGDYDGAVSINMSKIYGFGFLEGPLERLSKQWASGSEQFSGKSLSFIAQQVEQGYPVIVFANVNARDGSVIIEEPSPYTISWQVNGSDEIIHMPMYKHNLVVEGYVGSTQGPESFHIVDPFYGKKMEISSGNLNNILQGYNFSGVVIKY